MASDLFWTPLWKTENKQSNIYTADKTVLQGCEECMHLRKLKLK